MFSRPVGANVDWETFGVRPRIAQSSRSIKAEGSSEFGSVFVEQLSDRAKQLR